MAAMIASRKAISSARILRKLLTPARPLATTSPADRSFNTNAQLSDRDYEDDRSLDIDRSDWPISRRRSRDSSVSDVFDPFYPSKSLSQMFNLMDRMMENPFAVMSRGMGGGSRRGFNVKEDEEGLYMRIDMPGLGKEDVRVSVEQSTLIIKGEGEKESEDDESARRYSSRIDLPRELYELEQIKAEMKNGVLRVLIPKVKEEEKKDVLQVKIE